MKETETETTDLISIFKLFGIYRRDLSPENDKFVRDRLQEKYDTVTKTYILSGKTYKGTFRENSSRKENREAYEKECKLATVLASFGFDVILIEEDNSKPGKKPDAIVNGIVMDFKEVTAFYETQATKNTLGANYKDGMRKRFSNGVAIFLHEFSNDFVSKSMDFKETRRGKNGLALFFHEDTGSFQLFDMQKIRAAKLRQPLSRRAPDVSIELPDISNIPHSIKKSSITNSKDDDWDFEY
ncbi:MAG: hypothetical protein J6Y69_11560 [Treponema sp.]|nr:hypothetical protein [Treponema sp.]